MSVRVLYDPSEGAACMYDSVSGFAFGPLFYEHEVDGAAPDILIAEFVEWCGNDDPRSMRDGDLEQHVIQFLRNREDFIIGQMNESFS